ncbi:MAG: hypothetical protein CMO74_15745 [Verrucomicrobiales bacterium]|nr:hypothetical protein [Verrucomicrobiales bacterium]|tara:strand:- start:2006 stop:3205 length:1200 start_codon:yes stop_codon:yes gene_type:complete
MTLWLIVRKSLRQHALSTVITSLSIALAAGLLMSIIAVKDQSMHAFTNVTGGFHAVMGSRGSKLSLVLFSVFHMDKAPGTLPWKDFEDIQENKRIKTAVPIVVGDNFKGFRIVGTTTDFFRVEYDEGRAHEIPSPGRLFNPNSQEAVIGSHAARRLGLGIGDKFQPYHGLDYNPAEKHDTDYVVVGILSPSNTPADQVIWIPLKGLQNMPGHDSAKNTDVSAILLEFTSLTLGAQFSDQVNKSTQTKTVAMIAPEVTSFFQRFEWLRIVLSVMAGLVALVAAGGILASLHNTMNERRREIAILRALGARRGTVFGAIILESTAIAAIGVLIGFLFYAGFMTTAAHYIAEMAGVVINPLQPHPVLAAAPLSIIALGALAGILPALKAYRTDVAENLIPQS